MTLDELKARLPAFCEAKYGREVDLVEVVTMPGHAGFAYGFRVDTGSVEEAWFIRLPPPNVNWVGTADVLRQVEVLNALDASPRGAHIPHCSVRWSGSDLQWFDCPYFVVPWLEGDVLRLGPIEGGAGYSEADLLRIGEQAMVALANVHQIDIDLVPYLGEPVPHADDVVRWDRFYEKAADPERLAGIPACRARLLDTVPQGAAPGLFHGDFQTANLFIGVDGNLSAVIDWELTGVGAARNDLGWVCTFSDRAAWADGDQREMFLDPETLIAFYEAASGASVGDCNWYRALAAYKFAIITGFNLSLHRRRKRHDPSWEHTALSMQPLVDRALELLG